MKLLKKILTKNDKDKIAELIKISPEAYREFEDAYQTHLLNNPEDGLFGVPARMRSGNAQADDASQAKAIVSRIVNELLAESNALPLPDNCVTKEEISSLPPELRPQCTGTMMVTDINEPSSNIILTALSMALKKPGEHYGRFRAMLDCMDLDQFTYDLLGRNKASMGYWFPILEDAVMKQSFFKIPKTKICKVPLPILQMSRLTYESLTKTTLDIVNKWCMEAFNLDINKTYFVKTGVFSSKFDFRNAKVQGPDEVRSLGEYLLFISNQAAQFASPLVIPTHYGANTTNEWVVREYIEDTENNPTIYNGMPLRTEYRIFVDFDDGEIIGVSPYWRPDVMKARFADYEDCNEPEKIHDYIIYKVHEDTLMQRYNDNKDEILAHMQALILNMGIEGQWSIDVMQNGDDFYIIDMAPAEISALSDVVPSDKLKHGNLKDEVMSYLPAAQDSKKKEMHADR